MKKFTGLFIVLSVIFFAAWSPRPAFNKATGFTINLNDGTKNIPPTFCIGDVGVSNFNCRYKGLANKGYSHLGVINQTDSDISIVSSEVSSTAPSSTVEQKFYVTSFGAAAWDDVSIFNVLYFMSETGSSITSGKVRVTVW